MRPMLFALAAAGAAAIATPATAATVVYTSGSNVVLTFNPLTNDWDGAFRYRVINTLPGDPNGDFIAELTFISPIDGLGSATAGNVIVSGNLGSDIDFLTASINGASGFVINVSGASQGIVLDAPVSPGLNTLTFTGRLNPDGNRVGDGLVTGSLTVAAVAAIVPEPATWALFILGFGTIGTTLRRRSGAVRVSKAKLRFA